MRVAYYCNHEEADTRLVLHAARELSPSIVVAKDRDVFQILLYVMTQLPVIPDWYVKIQEEQFVSLRKIYDHFGQDVCSSLPQLHAVTGPDTTSYKFKCGKVQVFKKILKDPTTLGIVSQIRSIIVSEL